MVTDAVVRKIIEDFDTLPILQGIVPSGNERALSVPVTVFGQWVLLQGLVKWLLKPPDNRW